MSQIEELHNRISTAMERIGSGVTSLSAQAQAATGSMAALEQALDAAQQTNAELEEKLQTVQSERERELLELNTELEALRAISAQAGEADRLRDELAAQSDAMARLDMDVQRVRLANDQLRSNSEALRQANQEGVGQPNLINRAMLAELESLRALRAADAAEVGVVLARLDPLFVIPAQEDA